jgi:SAM-dependent methyltransferase
VPAGDKTNSLLSKNINYFHELFTKRNLLALAILKKQIESMEGNAKDFLWLAFSGSLKWASRQSHLRGEIVEGWALHAYWIYAESLEINVWNTFERRCQAIARGKRYSNQNIESCKFTEKFAELDSGRANCMIMTRSSANLPLPDASVDAIITDPPYGGNVNYGELSDYWLVWHNNGQLAIKKEEVIINNSQEKNFEDYENLLSSVFKECYRVLKTDRYLVSTFNSRDLRIVASFVLAASRAGFILHPEGLIYQDPIRAYNTTFHAMQIGAFVGDFIFTFVKQKLPVETLQSQHDFEKLKKDIKNLMNHHVEKGITEPQVREKAYRTLIPFLARYSVTDIDTCRAAVDIFEIEMRRHEGHFKTLRKKITDQRKKSYLSRKQK